MPSERELPPLHFRSVEELPSKAEDSQVDARQQSRENGRADNYAVQQAEEEFSSILFYAKNDEVNKKLQALDGFKRRLEDILESQFEVENKFEEFVSRNYSFFRDQNSVKNTFVNFQKVYERTGVKPLRFYSDFTFDLPDDFEGLNTVFNEPELFIFAKTLAGDTTSKSRMRALKEHIASIEPGLLQEEMRRTALQMTGMTQEKADEVYNHLVKIFLTEGLSLSLDYKDWQSIDLALELRKYFDIKSAGSQEENEQVENRYGKLITQFLQRIVTSTFSERDFLYICKRFQDEFAGLNSICTMPVPGIFAPQEVQPAYGRISQHIEKGWNFNKTSGLNLMFEFKKAVGVPPHDKGIVIETLIDSLKYAKKSNADESVLLQYVALAEELMETSFVSDENSRKAFYDAILMGKENINKREEVCAVFEKITNTARVFSEAVVQEEYKKLFVELTSVSFGERLASIKSFTHIKPDFKKKDIQPIVIDYLAEGANGISTLDFLRELTGEKQVYDDESVQTAYVHILYAYLIDFGQKEEEVNPVANLNLFFENLFVVSRYTNQYPVFKDNEKSVQGVYDKILKSGKPQDIVRFNEMWRLFSRVEPHYSQEAVDEAYQRCFKNGGIPALEILKLAIQQTPSPAGTKKLYGVLLEQVRRGKIKLQSEVENLQRVVGQAPNFDQLAVDTFYKESFNDYVGRKDVLLEDCDFLFSCAGVRPSPEIVGTIAGKHFVVGFGHGITAWINMPSNYPVEYHERMVVACVQEIESNITKDPRKLIKIVSEFDTNHPLNQRVKKLLEASPWIQALRAIEHIQGINENEANDPWKKELTPLMASSFDKQLISLEKAEDAEYLVRFVQEVGMINNIQLFKIFLACNRARNFEDLPEDLVAVIEKFGIRLRKPDGKWRLPGPRAIVSELRVAIRQMMVDLFKDKEIPALETELGGGLFSALRGSTQWERGEKISFLAGKWRETIARNPKVGELPEGVYESGFSVKELNINRAANQQKDQTIEGSINEIFNHKEIMVPYVSMSETLRASITEKDPAVWWKARKISIISSLGNAIEQLQVVLNATPEYLDAMIEMEENEDKKQLLTQKRAALSTERGRRAMEKQLNDLKHAKELVSAIEYLEEQSDEETIVRAMEILAYAGTTSYGIGRALRELSALHLIKTLPDGFREQLINEFSVNTEPTIERVNLLAGISRQFIFEHYLHPEQKTDHTGHSPFSKELLKELKSVWGIKFDNKGRMPIEVLNRRVQNVVHGDDTVSQEGIEVAMIPAKGILRIFGGDFGDACYTSQHSGLANGEYPGLFAWVYATNYGTPQVAIKGSLLGIVTEREDGAGALIARANNPKENFIRSVDHKQFVIQSLKEVINSARKMHVARLLAEPDMSVEKRRFSVAIPLDSSSHSSTNRPLVAEVYHKHFKSLPRVGFKNTPETNFNGYPIWNKSGYAACAVIWEIDENGKETWFGDWGDISVKQ